MVPSSFCPCPFTIERPGKNMITTKNNKCRSINVTKKRKRRKSRKQKRKRRRKESLINLNSLWYLYTFNFLMRASAINIQQADFKTPQPHLQFRIPGGRGKTWKSARLIISYMWFLCMTMFENHFNTKVYFNNNHNLWVNNWANWIDNTITTRHSK